MIGDLSESDPLEHSQTADLVVFILDAVEVEAPAGMSLLEACDAIGAYVPRLCSYPGLSPACMVSPGSECGLCLVRVTGSTGPRSERLGSDSDRHGSDSDKLGSDSDRHGANSGGIVAGSGRIVHACVTAITAGLDVCTDDPELRTARVERLAVILAGHPTACLACPDRDGCTRDECSYGNPAESRCCAEFARCELARLAAFVDPAGTLSARVSSVDALSAVTSSVGGSSPETLSAGTAPPGTLSAGGRSAGPAGHWPRGASLEGRIRREPRLCVRCGRCIVVCETLPEAGRVLVLEECGEGPAGARKVAAPRKGTLRRSGCTFCGRCVMVCPTGALTAPSEKGARWLADRREQSGLRSAILPPARREPVEPAALARVPTGPGVFQLMDAEGRVLQISGVADLRQGVARALAEPSGKSASSFVVELDLLYTQRESELLALYAQEHGELPPGNDLGDDLFG
jgi:ferredoxin